MTAEFLGYETEVAEARVEAIVLAGKPVEEIADGAGAEVVFNQTPFYGEAGGQVGDTGVMLTADGVEFRVTDTQKPVDDLHVHAGSVRGAKLAVGDVVELRLDGARRTAIRANHSATHLLHQALRARLGEHVTQKGSLVAPDRMRFDLSHPKAISADELADIEVEVNRLVRQNDAVETHLMSADEAVEAGALALFGEKYGDEVRVVSMGRAAPGEAGRYSTELCGGTHVWRTGDIGLFKIVSESAVAAGIRRVEVLTGEVAFRYLAAQEAELRQAAAALKVAPDEVAERVGALLGERRRLDRDLTDARRKLAVGGGGASAPETKEIDGVRYGARRLDDVPPKGWIASLVESEHPWAVGFWEAAGYQFHKGMTRYYRNR